MSNNIKESIEKLKEIRLQLFRSAANLDDAIRSLELEQDNPQGLEYLKMLVAITQCQREDCIHVYGWDELNEKEHEVWLKMFTAD